MEDKVEVEASIILLMLEQFDTCVSFMIKGREDLRQRVQDDLIAIIHDKRGTYGKNNNETKTTEGDLPLGIPMEATTGEPAPEVV